MQKIYRIILPIQFIIENSHHKNMQHIFHTYTYKKKNRYFQTLHLV